MRLLASTVAVLAAGALTLAPQSPPAPPERYVVPGDRAFPTGVAHDPSSGHFYVGSAEDGTIQRGHVDEPRTEVWSPDGTDGRSFTSALALDGAGHLYVNGGPTSTLRVYDPDDATLLATLKGKPGGFVNDVAPVSGKVAYVTDSFKPVIYRVARSGDRWTMRPWLDVRAAGIDWVDGEHNLNGIISVGRHLLAVQSNTGQLWRIDPASREVVEVTWATNSCATATGWPGATAASTSPRATSSTRPAPKRGSPSWRSTPISRADAWSTDSPRRKGSSTPVPSP